MTIVNLGDKVKDPVSGLIGIAIARTIWLQGCDRISVQPIGIDKDKKPYETTVVDEPQLLVITKKKIKKAKVSKKKTGGPLPSNLKINKY